MVRVSVVPSFFLSRIRNLRDWLRVGIRPQSEIFLFLFQITNFLLALRLLVLDGSVKRCFIDDYWCTWAVNKSGHWVRDPWAQHKAAGIGFVWITVSKYFTHQANEPWFCGWGGGCGGRTRAKLNMDPGPESQTFNNLQLRSLWSNRQRYPCNGIRCEKPPPLERATRGVRTHNAKRVI